MLITGASGFIGRNLVDACTESGRSVVSVVRDQAAIDALSSNGNSAFSCDICDTESIAKRLDGVKEIFHLAGVVCPYSQEKADNVNVDATIRLAEAASKIASPPKFIYVSSLAASGPYDTYTDEYVPRRETEPCRPVSIYGRSKLRAEIGLKQFADRLPISIVRPPGTFGPWDRNLLGMFQMVGKGWNLVGISKEFTYSFIHVEDLTRGLLAVADRGIRLATEDDLHGSQQPGVYFLADPRALTMVELGDLIAASLGHQRVRHLATPAALCWTMATISHWIGWLTGKRVFLNRDKMREAVAGSWVCDTTRARNELGFEVSKNLGERLQETHDWYKEHGWL